jgi:8-oxo-dGTP pyrophosphatase MutT (NUDIX family)
MLHKLKEILTERQKSESIKKQDINYDTSRKSSAVIVPVFNKNGEYHMLFTKRTERMRQHRGQISFPGGTREPRDKTLLDTALRECREEIGLDPGDVELLGEFEHFPTLETHFVIKPYIASIPWPYRFEIAPIEVDYIIEAPISALMDKNSLRRESEMLDGSPISTYFYNFDGQIIWGATARILTVFLDIYSGILKDKKARL